MQDTFADKWERWAIDGGLPEGATYEVLAGEYRAAWKTENISERRAVLEFVADSRECRGLDLVRQGLLSDDRELASIAVTTLMELVASGCLLDGPIDAEIQVMKEQHAELGEIGDAALTYVRLKA